MALAFLVTSSTLNAPAVAIAQSARVQDFGPSAYLPMLANNACSGTRDPGNPFGVQVYGAITGLAQHNVLQNSHSSWMRISIEWGKVEAKNVAPKDFNWTTADRAVRAARDNCVNLIITIDTTPEWATIGDVRSPFKTNLLPEFVEFVKATVERYDGDGVDDAPNGLVVKYWEFYNEPDAGSSPSGGGWGEYGTRYADMLKAVYPVVKAADSEAQVVIGGLAYDFFIGDGGVFVEEFLDNVLAAGGGADIFDYMNIHYYPFVRHRTKWTTGNSSGLVEKLAAVRAKMTQFGYGDKPLMITEVGWHSNDIASNPSTEDFQGRHVIQLMTQSIAAGATAAIWWPLFDSSGYQFKSGLATDTAALKASYNVFVEASKRLGQSTFIKVVMPSSTTSDLEVYEFRQAGTNKTMYVAWLNPIAPFNAAHVPNFDDTRTEKWQAPGSSATIYNKEGVQLQVIQDGADGSVDGKVTIAVRPNPLYIVIN